MAVAEPGAEGVRRQQQIPLGKLERAAVGHGVVDPPVGRRRAYRVRDLPGRTYLRRLPVPASLPVVGEPTVLSIRDEDAAVGEFDLVTRPADHDLAQRDHGGGPAVGADEPIADLDLAHRRPAVGRRKRRVQCQSFSEAGPAGHDDQLAGVQAVEQPVEVGEPGRYAGHHATLRTHRLDLVQGRLEQFGQDREVLADPPVGDVVHRLLGEVDQVVHVPAATGGRPVPELDDPGAGLDQPAEHGALGDDPRVVGGVGGGRHAGDQRVQVRGAADPTERPGVGERGGHRDGVGGLAPPVQVQDRVEDRAVRRLVEVDDLEDLHDVGDGVLGQHHPAEYALLRGDVLGRRPVVLAVAAARVGRARLCRPYLIGDRHRDSPPLTCSNCQ